MTHWNYRVIRFEEVFKNEEVATISFAIHEVYYHVDGKPSLYGECAAVVLWNEGENGLDILDMMREAFEKPVLTPEDFK